VQGAALLCTYALLPIKAFGDGRHAVDFRLRLKT